MTMLQSKFKTTLSAAILAIALGAATVGVMPTQAQDGPIANFSIQIPGGNGLGNNDGPVARRGGNHDDGQDYGFRCLTNREVRRGIASYGFSRVQVTREFRRDRVEVAGQYGNWLYSMRVDKCSGEVDRVQRIQRAHGGGFGLQFNFGN